MEDNSITTSGAKHLQQLKTRFLTKARRLRDKFHGTSEDTTQTTPPSSAEITLEDFNKTAVHTEPSTSSSHHCTSAPDIPVAHRLSPRATSSPIPPVFDLSADLPAASSPPVSERYCERPTDQSPILGRTKEVEDIYFYINRLFKRFGSQAELLDEFEEKLDYYVHHLHNHPHDQLSDLQDSIQKLSLEHTALHQRQDHQNDVTAEIFEESHRIIFLLLQNIQHYAAVQAYSHNHLCHIINHLLHRDHVLTQWIDVLQHNQLIHNKFHSDALEKGQFYKTSKFPPYQAIPPPVPAPLPTLEAPHYPEVLIHAPQFDPDIDVPACDDEEPSPSASQDDIPPLEDNQPTVRFFQGQDLPKDFQVRDHFTTATKKTAVLRYKLVKGNWKRVYYTPSRFGHKARSAEAFEQRQRKFKERHQQKMQAQQNGPVTQRETLSD